MADTTFLGIFPALKAVDNGDGTFSVAVTIPGMPPLTGMTAGELLVATSATTAAWQNTGVKLADLTFNASVDSALVADEVSLGGYDIAPGERSLAISQENPVVVAAAGASDRYLPIRVNGATFKLLLHT